MLRHIKGGVPALSRKREGDLTHVDIEASADDAVLNHRGDHVTRIAGRIQDLEGFRVGRGREYQKRRDGRDVGFHAHSLPS